MRLLRPLLLITFLWELPPAWTLRCELAAFLENDDGSDSFIIDSGLVSSELKECSETNEKTCERLVVEEARFGTSDGNFTLLVKAHGEEIYSVGDVLCDKADAVREDVRFKNVRVHYRLCSKDWIKTSYVMPNKLCCEDGLYVPCGIYERRTPISQSH